MENRFRTSLYESYVADHQGEISERRSRAALEAHVVRHLPVERDLAVLDVGCGQGQLMRCLEEHGYGNVSGIDLSEEQVDLARRLGTERVRHEDVFEHAAMNTGVYDVVLAIDLVEHFDRVDVLNLFRAIGSLLKPGGVLILRTPNGSSPYSGRIFYSDLTQGVAYTERSLKQVGAATGFESMRGYPARPAGNGARQLARRVLWLVIEGLFKLPLIVETGHARGHIVTQNIPGSAVGGHTAMILAA